MSTWQSGQGTVPSTLRDLRKQVVLSVSTVTIVVVGMSTVATGHVVPQVLQSTVVSCAETLSAGWSAVPSSCRLAGLVQPTQRPPAPGSAEQLVQVDGCPGRTSSGLTQIVNKTSNDPFKKMDRFKQRDEHEMLNSKSTSVKDHGEDADVHVKG